MKAKCLICPIKMLCILSENDMCDQFNRLCSGVGNCTTVVSQIHLLQTDVFVIFDTNYVAIKYFNYFKEEYSMSDFKDKCGDVLTGGATGAAIGGGIGAAIGSLSGLVTSKVGSQIGGGIGSIVAMFWN